MREKSAVHVALQKFRLELRERERVQRQQNAQDTRYLMAAFRGQPDDGKGVTPDFKARIEREMIKTIQDDKP